MDSYYTKAKVVFEKSETKFCHFEMSLFFKRLRNLQTIWGMTFLTKSVFEMTNSKIRKPISVWDI